MSKNMVNEEYWRISAKDTAAELGLTLTDDQLQTLMAYMFNAAEMESEATGNWVATRNLNADQTTHKERRREEMLNNLHTMYMNLTTVRVLFDGNWENEIKSSAAKDAHAALYDYLSREC